MDASVDAAVSAVQLDDETARQRWFDYLRTTADQHQDADWTQLSAALTEGAMSAGVDSHVVERFLEHMQRNDSTPGDTIKDMMAMSATELPNRYRELAAESAEATTGAGAAPEDTSAWNSFLAEHGKYWDGTDTAWAQFKTWFCYEATQRGVGTSATGFIEYAESQSDKVAVFHQYGVTIAQVSRGEARRFRRMGRISGQDFDQPRILIWGAMEFDEQLRQRLAWHWRKPGKSMTQPDIRHARPVHLPTRRTAGLRPGRPVASPRPVPTWPARRA